MREEGSLVDNIGALIIRIGFWGPVHYSYDKEPPKQYRSNFGVPK